MCQDTMKFYCDTFIFCIAFLSTVVKILDRLSGSFQRVIFTSALVTADYILYSQNDEWHRIVL